VPDTPPSVRPVIDRAEINIVERGPFAGAAAHQFERADTTLHHVLQPAWAQPTPEPPAPAPPTEADLRDRLADAVHAQRLTDETAARAEQAHERAEQNRQDCQRRVAEFVSLDHDLSEAVAGALRTGGDPAAARAAFAPKLDARAQAQADAIAAEDAVTTLRGERAQAAKKAGDATREADVLAAKVLTFAAVRIAGEIQQLQAQIRQRRRALLGYDRATTPFAIGFPLLVRQTLGEVNPQEVLQSDPAPWKLAAQALKNDPLAEVEIALPPIPAAPADGPPTAGAGGVATGRAPRSDRRWRSALAGSGGRLNGVARHRPGADGRPVIADGL
jgi:hypothetical protein